MSSSSCRNRSSTSFVCSHHKRMTPISAAIARQWSQFLQPSQNRGTSFCSHRMARELGSAAIARQRDRFLQPSPNNEADFCSYHKSISQSSAAITRQRSQSLQPSQHGIETKLREPHRRRSAAGPDGTHGTKSKPSVFMVKTGNSNIRRGSTTSTHTFHTCLEPRQPVLRSPHQLQLTRLDL